MRKTDSFVSVDPVAGSTIESDATLTLRFDSTPEDVNVNIGTARISGNTVTVTGPFDLGPLTLQVTWTDGSQALQYTVRRPVAYVSVNPRTGSTIESDATLTLQFDGTPEDVSVNKGTVKVAANTITITGPFTPGALALQVTWQDGTQVLNYTVRKPVSFVSVSPRAGTTIETDTPLTLQFDAAPQNLRLNKGTANITGNTVTVSGPFAPGPLRLELTWDDGTQVLNYTVQTVVTFISASPKAGSTIETNTPISVRFDDTPKNVRVSTGTAKTADNTVTVNGPFTPGDLSLEITWDGGQKTLAYTVLAPVGITSVTPDVGSTIETDTAIVLKFDSAPQNVKVNTGTARTVENTLTITGPFASGALRLQVTWDDGTRTLNYTVRKPVSFVSVNPKAGATIETDAPLTLQFDGTPQNVQVSKGTAETSGNTSTITGPFTPGALRLEVTWEDGAQTLQYTVRKPVAFVSVSPREGSTISADAALTLRFDGTPENVRVNTGTAQVVGSTVTLTGTFSAGALRIEVTWRDGKQTLQYTVREEVTEIPEDPPVEETILPEEPPVEVAGPSAQLVSVSPRAGSSIAPDENLILRFDNPPENVRVSKGTAKTSGNTVNITGPFDPGALRVEVTWGNGKQTLQYTVQKSVTLRSVSPRAGSTIEANETLTLRFDGTPENVRVSKGTVKTNGDTVTITGPFDPGALRIEVTWRDGKQILQYTVRTQNASEWMPDPNLRAAVREALGLGPNTSLTREAMLALIELKNYNVSDRHIKDLTGLEHATRLEVLELRDRNYNTPYISDLSPLAKLTQLTSVALNDNEIRDISPLAKLTQLKNLQLAVNEIRDISPLAKLTQLTSLTLNDNEIRDISPLAELTQLTSLTLRGNQISDVTPLAGLIQLTSLTLRGNQINDVTPLAHLVRLVKVDINVPNQQVAGGVVPDPHLAGAVREALKLTNLQPITKQVMKQLTNLSSEIGQIKDLTGLEHATQLKRLNLGYNQIRDISHLTGLTHLTFLFLNGNGISDISPLAKLTQLKELWITHNQISDISPLAELTELEMLALDKNQISDISPLAELTKLKRVSLGRNPIADVEPLRRLIKQNPNLEINGVNIN